MRIGVFDSGIGGINVLKELMKSYPHQEYIYYGDTYYLPYGEKDEEELLLLSNRIIHFFEIQKVDMIIIACGTCSSLKDRYQSNIPIYDVIAPTVEYVKKKYKKVALLATPATIQNGMFEKKLQNEGIKTIAYACPNFVPFLEGLSKNRLCISKELNKLLGQKIDAVILGCTHYPLLKESIESILKVPSIDMGKCITASLKIKDEKKGSVTIYMSKKTENIEQTIFSILNQKIQVIEKNLPV